MEASDSTESAIMDSSVNVPESVKNPSNGDNQLFSSEDFKIEIQNLPKFYGMGQMKKLMINKLKLNPHKLKPCGPKSTFMYVCFKSEDEKQKALVVIDGFEFKGNRLRAKAVKGVIDPYQKKKEWKAKETVVDTRPVPEKLQDAVCPLARYGIEYKKSSY